MKYALAMIVGCGLGIGMNVAVAAGSPGNDSIQQLNAELSQATLAMDNKALLQLWDEDGISLLPQTPPIHGKAAIAAFLDRVSAQMPGARMKSFEMQCHDVTEGGDWASEWCEEHQIVQMPDGKPPFEGRGRMLFVLHRQKGGNWRLHREMWIPAEAPRPGN